MVPMANQDESVNSSEWTVSDVAMSSTMSSIASSLSTAHHFISIKLTHKNFLIWRTQVVPFLHGHDLMGFIEGTLPCPATLGSDVSRRYSPC